MQRSGPRSGKHPLNPPLIRGRAHVVPLTRSRRIGVPRPMPVSLILKHLVQLAQRLAKVRNIPGPNRQRGPAPVPIRQHGRIPDNNHPRLRGQNMDPFQKRADLRRGSVDPLGQLVVPARGQPVFARRRGRMRSRTRRRQLKKTNIITADTKRNQRRLGVHSVQLRRVGAIGRLLRNGQVGGRGATTADIGKLSRLQLRRDKMWIVVIGPLTPNGRPSRAPSPRRRSVRVTQRNITPGPTTGVRAIRWRRRRAVLPLVVPEGQQPDHEHNNETAAPTLLRHSIVSTGPSPTPTYSIRVTRCASRSFTRPAPVSGSSTLTSTIRPLSSASAMAGPPRTL